MGVLSFLVLFIANSFRVSSSPLTAGSDVPWSNCISESAGCNKQDELVRGDPVTSFRIAYPEDGAVQTLPIHIYFYAGVTDMNEYNAYLANAHICVELNGLWRKCKGPRDSRISFTELPTGNYTAIAYITDAATSTRYHETIGVKFQLLGVSELKTHNERLMKKIREEQQFPEDIGLLRWAEQVKVEPREDNNVVLPRTNVSATSSPMLVIGVKTEVITSFPRRQAIRDSWANPATIPSDVRVLFLGGEPNMTVVQSDFDRRRVLKALAKEREAYRDLLTLELECIDSYRNLSNKVKAFMHLAVAEFPRAKFVMLVDDDVYLKVDQLADHLRRADSPRLYFGEVFAVRFAHKQTPIRNPESPYYLPFSEYSMQELLPYTSGPHYVVPMDGIRFIAKNSWRLRSLNGLEDVSSALWLRNIGIKAQHSAKFSSIRGALTCEDNLVSFADLSPLGIRSIHANLLNHRNFCYGFDSVMWFRHVNSVSSLSKMLQRSSEEPSQELEMYVYDLDPKQVTLIISTHSNGGVKLRFILPLDVQILCTQVQLHFSASPSTCHALHRQLQLQLDPATSVSKT